MTQLSVSETMLLIWHKLWTYIFNGTYDIKTVLIILIIVSFVLTLQLILMVTPSLRMQTSNDNNDFDIDFRKLQTARDRMFNQRMIEYNLAFPHVTCVKFQGGLGNNLFQYASAYGLARKIGLEVVILASSTIFQMFSPVAKVVTDAKLCSQVKPVTERKSSKFDPAFFDITPDADYRFQYYLQSRKYFDHVSKELRQQLVFRGDILARAKFEIDRHIYDLDTNVKRKQTFIGLHVRRGDYLEPYYVRFGYKIADMTYIDKSMDYMKLKYGDVIYFVLSNDILWCKININRPNVYFVDDNEPEVDLAIMSLLNHTIMTVGTFGYWGAWLCNGDTIYMKDFAEPGSEYALEFSDVDNYFYQNWIGL